MNRPQAHWTVSQSGLDVVEFGGSCENRYYFDRCLDMKRVVFIKLTLAMFSLTRKWRKINPPLDFPLMCGNVAGLSTWGNKIFLLSWCRRTFCCSNACLSVIHLIYLVCGYISLLVPATKDVRRDERKGESRAYKWVRCPLILMPFYNDASARLGLSFTQMCILPS